MPPRGEGTGRKPRPAGNQPEKPSPPKKKDVGEKSPSLIQVAFPQQASVVFFSAVVLGLLLIFMPIAFYGSLALNGTQANLILCIGAALVLAAFGGQATVKVGSAIMAGVAAVALGLFIYLQNSSQRQFVEGVITGVDYDKYQAVRIKNKNPILGSLSVVPGNQKNSIYRFVILRDEISYSRLVVSLLDRSDTELATMYVNVADLERGFGSRQPLEWDLRDQKSGDDTSPGLFDTNLGKFVTNVQVASAAPPPRVAASAPLFSMAAQAAIAAPPVDVALALKQLTSDDTVVRRGARDALSTAPVDAIPVIMKAFREQFDNYQMKLGICVALAQMLRGDKSKGPAISAKLIPDDRSQLVAAAIDSDRTVRVYATEFLFDLSDPDIATLAIKRAATTDDEDTRYTLMFISRGGWLKLSAADKKALSGALAQVRQRSTGKARALADQFQI